MRKLLIAFLLMSASLCFGQGLTVQFQNAGTPIDTFKKWLPINCTTTLTCAMSNGVVTLSLPNAVAGPINPTVFIPNSSLIASSSGSTTTTGTISGGSASLAVASASTWLPNQDIYIPSAGPQFVLSAAGNASAGVTAYTGTITGGASNAFVGLTFTVAGFMYRKIKNPFTLAFWSIDLRGVGDLPCSGGREAENRTFVEDNDDVY
jgi:hypothetical protein